ncbi:Formamidase [Emiliania huxleyi CCMP1516]|uniref:Formamidase n=2 Tax=Emiliania huxleyi TaxID=2903 RepID=A0A0D3KIS4_EMIH1|nr:Formamidase [Emiliania huxleyi CCMP1516]EOD35659.1 Formamidase [Emiliania huxleyi CCMP1516]|eukprot:XP_005788088.1 Formamidase [Emiliania huxleyi CCMP1516]
MPKTLLSVDPKKLPWEQDPPVHNRWHPDIPPTATVAEGDVFRVETIDWTGGQIKNDDSADDVKHVDLTQVHYLSGPISVPTAQPGDLLKVEILDVGPLAGDEWGFTGTFHKDNGGGFLTDHYPEATKACWDFEGVYAQSRHIPGVRFAGLIHPGLIGTAPSQELLDMWNSRESALQSTVDTPKMTTTCAHMHTRPLATWPNPTGAMLGKVGHFKHGPKEAGWERIAGEAARTVPGRENGGNCDIKNLSRGCSLYLPVFVPGANLSMGDMHFSQGDGEVSFCGAIEMSGFLDLKLTVIKGGMKLLPVVGPSPLSVNPIFEIGPMEPRYSEYLVFEGVSVDENGVQHFLDATLAYKRAVLNCIKYLANFGYTEEQIYLLLSCCPCEGRISGIVDVPNAVATLAIPLAIFDRDVRPKAGDALEALAKGITIKKVFPDCAHESTPDTAPAPLDPRL